MKLEINARGLACPEPVLKAKAVVESQAPEHLDIIVDNEAAVENLGRFLGLQGYETTASGGDGEFRVSALRKGTAPAREVESTPTAAQTDGDPTDGDQGPEKILVFVPTDRMGFGDDELGKKLMVSFIKTLKEMGEDLWQLIFVNNGVKLAIGGSPVLEELKAYEEQGLQILVCGTCLSHFDLLEAKQVGETTNMLDIVTAMQLADKVIQPA